MPRSFGRTLQLKMLAACSRAQSSAAGAASQQFLRERVSDQKLSRVTHRPRAQALMITALDDDLRNARLRRYSETLCDERSALLCDHSLRDLTLRLISATAFAKAAQSVAENTPRALEAVAKWQAVQLSQVRRVEFARRAAALRWDDGNPVVRALTPEKLLAPVRYGDAATDLWTTFNVVQEHLIRGGDRYLGRSDFGLRRNRTRPVGGLTEGQKLNKALWTLAGEFSQN